MAVLRVVRIDTSSDEDIVREVACEEGTTDAGGVAETVVAVEVCSNGLAGDEDDDATDVSVEGAVEVAIEVSTTTVVAAVEGCVVTIVLDAKPNCASAAALSAHWIVTPRELASGSAKHL